LKVRQKFCYVSFLLFFFAEFSHPKLVKFVQACPNGMEKIILFKNFKRPDEAAVIPS
jgi:hypothetical protein